ncbi:hypothetical protein [Pseudogemmobacter faecipullorum]|uniref:Uncharacterized protein n=1 Tax=Pseudogemmobacter faecipullorum TaxID=2755041 RepID=A0ABS8CQ45_9RHOB|nr:hypothetical protein [Pseudogemmobacter faecipullorum]MCB5411491.1 hypothetical protein [Pseudogemmobacter faecipullorum]
MGKELGLAERLRVAAALNPEGFSITLSREAAIDLVRIIEQRKRVADADQWVHGLLAERSVWFERREAEFRKMLAYSLAMAVCVIHLSWLLMGWGK